MATQSNKPVTTLQQTAWLLDIPPIGRCNVTVTGFTSRSPASAEEPSGEGDDGIHQAAFKNDGRARSRVN